MSSAEPSPVQAADLGPFASELARSWRRETPDLTLRQLDGTLVFADISGFTRLTERLAAKGRVGAEEMSDHLDLVLSALLAAAYEYGGWLVKWGGDALLLMFEDSDHAARACVASAAMRSQLKRVGALDTSVGHVRLRMSIAVHTGQFTFHLVGHRHRELLITGAAATLTARLEAVATAGDILLSRETAAALPNAWLGDSMGDGVLLARPPVLAPTDVPGAGSSRSLVDDVSDLVPELILDHLADGGGSGEHRSATVAFVEFSGLSRLQERNGTTAVGDAVAGLVQAAQEACHRNRVSFHETDISPDGGKIMLVAGAPRALEDPADAMLYTLRQLFDEPGLLPVRAGVTSGRVFTGAVGPAQRRSYSVKGDVVNLAARIMGKAPMGEIWALPSVAESAHTNFELAGVAPFMVKGKRAPVTVRSVGRALGRRQEVRPALPLVGRGEEMAILRHALDEANCGRGGRIELVGEAGIGKSRLLAELRALARDYGPISISADLYRAAAPYSLARPLLLAALGVEPESPAAALVEHVAQWLRAQAPHLSAWLPLLGPVLDATIADTTETRDLAPEFRAERIHDTVDQILTLALPTPSLLVVDNIQFADLASVELLRYVAERATGRPRLVVLAGRLAPTETTAGPETPQLVMLSPLTEQESAELVHADTEAAPLAPHVLAAVVARAAGNPLFLRQLAATVHTISDAADLPDSIETVVAARIDGLRPESRDLLRAAAVVGISVERELLVALVSSAADPTGAAFADLGEFLASDGPWLRFRQPVIRDAAYEGLPFRRRAQLHGRLADLLADRESDERDELPAVLSLHYFRAGRFAMALPTAQAAGDRAAAAYANSEAVLLYRRALDSAAGLPGDPPATRADLLEKIGDAQWRLGEYESSDRSYTAASRLLRTDATAVARIGLKLARSAERRGNFELALDRLRRVRTVIDTAPRAKTVDLRLRTELRTGYAQFRRGRLSSARTHFENLIAEEQHGDPKIVAEALAILDVVETNLGLPHDGSRARRALELYEQLGELLGQATTCTQIGYSAYFEGRWVEAGSAYARARDLFERLGDLPQAAVNDANLAELLLDQGHFDQAETALRKALKIWQAAGADNDVAFGQTLLGRVMARTARFDESDALLARARERFAQQGARSEVVDADTYRAECLQLRGQPADALTLATRTLVTAGRLSAQPVQAPLLHRIIGACQDALGYAERADLAYAKALELARSRGADHEIAFTLTAMAQRAGRAGRTPDAQLMLELAALQRNLGLVVGPTTPEAAD